MLLLKIITLQIFWILTATQAKSVQPLIFVFTALFLVYLNYKYYRPSKSQSEYYLIVFIFTLFGLAHDTILIASNIIDKSSYTYTYLCLWPIFICYFGDVFKKFEKFSLAINSIIGGVAGSLTYWGAKNLGSFNLGPGKESLFLSIVFLMWLVLFPLFIRIYKMNFIIDYLLDLSVIYSFDKRGFKRHSKKFSDDIRNLSAKGKNILVTGGTSGIGSDVAKFLASRGGNIFVTGRNSKKGNQFADEFDGINFVQLDMSSWKDINAFSASNNHIFDVVVLNAGGMPESLEVNEQGVEHQCASQLNGHYYLIENLLKDGFLSKGAKIIWVSSGGMYLKKLDLENLFENNNYEKVQAYANVKRAQVTLVEEMAKKDLWKDFTVVSMHPGWVETPGLINALPQFCRFMKGNLRSLSEGADTINWLALTSKPLKSGAFYFDRKIVSPYITNGHNPSMNEREVLLQKINGARANHA